MRIFGEKVMQIGYIIFITTFFGNRKEARSNQEWIAKLSNNHVHCSLEYVRRNQSLDLMWIFLFDLNH